jgi:hypothetical protein
MTQLMPFPYTIKAKGCVTGTTQLSKNERGRLASIGAGEKQKGRRKAGLS